MEMHDSVRSVVILAPGLETGYAVYLRESADDLFSLHAAGHFLYSLEVPRLVCAHDVVAYVPDDAPGSASPHRWEVQGVIRFFAYWFRVPVISIEASAVSAVLQRYADYLAGVAPSCRPAIAHGLALLLASGQCRLPQPSRYAARDA